jgi:hypothetical protein
MEYSLQKNLESNIMFASLNNTSMHPHFSAMPAKDFCTPGVGKLATNLYAFYVPIFGRSSPYEIKKIAANPDQVGSGNVSNVNIEPQNQDQESVSNQNKRKLDDGVAESFLHPKMIKTKTIILKPVPKAPKVQKDDKLTTGGLGKVKSSNHKFQFF